MPMSTSFIQQVRRAIATLNPNEIRDMVERPVRILVQATSEFSYRMLESHLLPDDYSDEKRREARHMLVRASSDDASGRFQLVFYERGTPLPEGWTRNNDAFEFAPARPGDMVQTVIAHRDDYALALARLYPPFRTEVAQKTIHTVSKENALFSIMTALPNVVPSLAEVPWAIGEFASDTAVLTANQIRMAFLLAAASDRVVGYREQRNEIGSIMAGAWGWRTVARQLTGKIPFGGGLIPKAAIAYAGTYVVGLSLERYYRLGYHLSRDERSEAYDKAMSKGREVASALLQRIKARKDEPGASEPSKDVE